MDFDLPGRIKHTRLLYSDALLPVFEGVVNSIHAIHELSSNQHGTIRIQIVRDTSQVGLPFDNAIKASMQQIRSFTILDNGIGFTDIHFKSFCTADTQQKASLGGKGIGRFLWLKAFDHAEIKSIFRGADNKLYKRTFSLRLTPSGVEDHALEEASAEDAIGTIVQLRDIRPEYQGGIPHSSETVGRRVVEHCLEHFVLGSAPTIYVDDAGESNNLDQFFEEHVKVTSTVGEFRAGERQFNIHHLRVSTGYQTSHKLQFCANNRPVCSESLTGKIANLGGHLREESGRSFLYAGYVSGQYLDDSVNSERTDFVMPDDDSLVSGPGWQTILRNSIESAASFISEYTKSVKDTKERQIAEFVQNRAPQYRPVVKHRKDLLDQIPPELSEEKLDLELHRIDQIYEAELREKSSTILTSLERGPEDWEAFEQRYASFLEEWNEAGIAKLARHIVHRKATLEFLKASLKANAAGRYQLETAIHQLIFPLRRTSDDVRPDQMNLWILDEKLAYHYYLASDMRFDQQEIKHPSQERADIIIYNGPAAFVNDTPPFSSIVLIEFKRPLRDDYTDEDNPIAQLYRYIELIKSGKATDRGGRPIAIKPDTPIYAYLVCDLTPTLVRQAKFASLAPTPDGLGYFGFNPQLGVLVEIINFDKLVTDAERRNAAHFDQLNLPR